MQIWKELWGYSEVRGQDGVIEIPALMKGKSMARMAARSTCLSFQFQMALGCWLLRGRETI